MLKHTGTYKKTSSLKKEIKISPKAKVDIYSRFDVTSVGTDVVVVEVKIGINKAFLMMTLDAYNDLIFGEEVKIETITFTNAKKGSNSNS